MVDPQGDPWVDLQGDPWVDPLGGGSCKGDGQSVHEGVVSAGGSPSRTLGKDGPHNQRGVA